MPSPFNIYEKKIKWSDDFAYKSFAWKSKHVTVKLTTAIDMHA